MYRPKDVQTGTLSGCSKYVRTVILKCDYVTCNLLYDRYAGIYVEFDATNGGQIGGANPRNVENSYVGCES